MRIVSLNAWGGQVWPALGSYLSGVGADVLCLQEMIHATEPCPSWLAYRDAYRNLYQRSDLFADIYAGLPDHRAEFWPAVEGPLEDNSGRSFRSQHGLGQWIAPGLQVLGRYDGFVHGGFRKDGWGAEPVPRGFQAVKVTKPGRARPVTIAHFHGLRDADGKHDTQARRVQAQAACALLSQITHPAEDVVLAGDFNVLPDSDTLQILSDWGLRDLVGDRDTRTTLYPKPVRSANYLMVSRSVGVGAFDAPASPVVSDHRPLVLDL